MPPSQNELAAVTLELKFGKSIKFDNNGKTSDWEWIGKTKYSGLIQLAASNSVI